MFLLVPKINKLQTIKNRILIFCYICNLKFITNFFKSIYDEKNTFNLDDILRNYY